ncbi:hypothetical protein CPAR01_10884 [Colletotrichum paranaense]|uniref:Uncharacterized protein n=1 Tax=Colletotrichum paranaense TaxID=1914294 RepID=A0ABQ9SBD3_9PEZI|nr:uncharacterized protein CPAR01_10884 [Colletotrichum paranaense]KAK1531235.1 hypothetical protein CPAR01_10884 [Colletotrichum paranaense]
MDDELLTAVARTEVSDYFNETTRKQRTTKPAPCQITSTVEEKFIDSGYSSPNDPISLSECRDELQNSKPLYGRGIPIKLGGQNLLRFKAPPDKSTNDRFKYMTDQIEPLLLARLKKTDGRFGPTAIRKMILGTSEEDAHEHLVVLCPSQLVDNIKEFFEKTKIVKQLCESTEQTSSVSIIVEGREPRLTAKLSHSLMSMDRTSSDFADFGRSDKWSLCGRALSIKSTQRDVRVATCGGVIKVLNPAGRSTLYGMTVGHVFDDENMACSRDYDFERHSYKAFSRELSVYGCGDWEILNLLMFGSNRYRTRNPSGRTLEYSLATELGTFTQDAACQEVEMIANADYSRPGLLSNEPARILFETADAFTPAYMLTMNDGEVREGDSGAWVVGSAYHEVFGHIVAADMFGDAYVLPLEETFEAIRKSLGAASVQLASPQDFAVNATRILADSANREIYELSSEQSFSLASKRKALNLAPAEQGSNSDPPQTKRYIYSDEIIECDVNHSWASDEEAIPPDSPIDLASFADSAYGSADVTPTIWYQNDPRTCS